MGEPRDETWYLETKKRIREAFQLFDKDRKGCVVQEEVATIMRYLGAYPTERAVVKEILPDMMGEEASAFVKYETFERSAVSSHVKENTELCDSCCT